MATNRIMEAYLPLERRNISLSEYNRYLRSGSSWSELRKNIFCPECGDELTYVEGKNVVSYFKHSPSSKGHDYCSLYSGHGESNTCESIIRKRLFTEMDIQFNYVIQYRNENWENYITIPPFKENEIEANEKNNTCIAIKFANSKQSAVKVKVDFGQFSPNIMKKIKIPIITNELSVKVTGQSNDYKINFDGFNASTQIYKYVLDGEYWNSSYALNDKATFALKRVSGKIFSNCHYAIFVKETSMQPDITQCRKNGIYLTAINIPELEECRCCVYRVYDVLFAEECFENGKIKTFVEEFCTDRGCQLVEDEEIQIIWPPVNSEENRKYFGAGEELYLYSPKQKMDPLKKVISCGSTFFVKENTYQKTYVLFRKRERKKLGHGAYIVEKRKNPVADCQGYLLKKDVLIEKNIDKHKILSNETFVICNNLLNRKTIKNIKDENADFINAIRYGMEYMTFEKETYEKLVPKYEDNETVRRYLDYCLKEEKIKRDVIDLMQENKNED